jgi:menaquinone-9 beta-reductase
MAERGARVLVLERTPRFRDRVRGEGMYPWGVTEARALGLYDTLRHTCAHETPWLARYQGSTLLSRRDLVTTTTHRAGCLTFYHPAMQEVLLRVAADAGAAVQRQATVTQVAPGTSPAVSVRCDGKDAVFQARLVVGADGRQSQVRHWAGFMVSYDPKRLLIAGVLFTGMPAEDDGPHTAAADALQRPPRSCSRARPTWGRWADPWYRTGLLPRVTTPSRSRG